MARAVYVARHDFTATREDEVSLRAGDLVEEVEEGGDWWRGRTAAGAGTFPACFLEKVEATGRCTVVHPFTPRYDDEVELVVGREVEVFGEVEEGTWGRGLVAGRLGAFPLPYVRLQGAEQRTPRRGEAAVQLRRSTSRLRSTAHLSLCPVSGDLFPTEDEPPAPLFGSLSSRLGDVSMEEQERAGGGGFLSRLRHSLGGKAGRQRLSSGSYLETQSVCSPGHGHSRRRSLSGFLHMLRGGARAGSRVSLGTLSLQEEEQARPGRLSRSEELFSPKKVKGKVKDKVKGKVKGGETVVKDFSNLSLSTDDGEEVVRKDSFGRGRMDSFTRNRKDSFSFSLKPLVPSRSFLKKKPLDRSDSGFGDSEAAAAIRASAEEQPFGPMDDLTDQVFQDMFSSGKAPAARPATRASGIRTSVGQLGAAAPSGGRSSVATNPLTRWQAQPGDQQVTEL